MDPITQGALGAACAQTASPKKFFVSAFFIGAAAGMAADLDVLIRSANDPMLLLIYHRHFTHALMFSPIGALLVSILLLLLKPKLRSNWLLVYLSAFWGFSSHGLLDACTSYGTLLYWPFSYQRISWDIISIVDPLFTIPLVIGVAWTAIMQDRKGVMFALGFAIMLLCHNAWQHDKARAALPIKQFTHIEKIRVIPKLSSSTRWRGFIMTKNEIHIFHIVTPYWGQTSISPIANLSLFKAEELPEYVKKSPSLLRDFKVFAWFTDGYLHKVQDQPLILIDARYLIQVRPLLALWGIEFKPGQKHIRRLGLVKD